ncbi:MAG: T9SS type A sorting domain-containing protein [Bacteroidales bacterium]|nr:T9SS type A sorting domain-containing protein [Bacteroidales bacterium]
MKKFLLSIVASVMIAGSVSAQNVARECVLIEAFTGIGCPYCPAAANGISQMLQEGLSIAPIAFHNSYYSPAEYANTETNGRATYYSVNSFPTVLIDGMNKIEGGGTASSSMYNKYKPYYDERISKQSPFTIDLSFDYHSGTQCEAKAVVTKVGDCDGTDLRVFIVLTESHIQQSWQGLPELNAVCRDIVTSSSGVALTEDTQEVTGMFSLAGYKKENCELIAWVQSYNGQREVWQAVKMPIATSASQYDLGIVKVEEVPSEVCSGVVAPRMTIRNYGSEMLQSATFQILDDTDSEIGTYQWSGALPKGAQTEFIMPEIDFAGSSFLKIQAVNLNGSNNDEFTYDNNYVLDVVEPTNIEEGYMKIQLKTGDDNQNFSIEIKNMDNGEVLKTLTFEQPNKVYTEEVTVPEFGCYRVTFKNSAGNGCGSGFWGIKDANNKTIVSGSSSSNAFRYEMPVEVKYSSESVENVVEAEPVSVYPNPANSYVNVVAENIANVTVYNSIGQLIYTETVDNNFVKINAESWVNGMYFVNVVTADGSQTLQKVVVNK